MSRRGAIVRAAGAHLKRNNNLGVGIGHPGGGDEGDIRVQMVDSSPRLYAKAGGRWYGVGLEKRVTNEFSIGNAKNSIKISPKKTEFINDIVRMIIK